MTQQNTPAVSGSRTTPQVPGTDVAVGYAFEALQRGCNLAKITAAAPDPGVPGDSGPQLT